LIKIIIQARMTSSRLPGKVLLPLCGSSVLQVMLERLSVLPYQLIIATTNDGTERPIVQLCQKMGISYFQGDTDNVLERYYQAASHFEAQQNDTIVRLTSDCPLISPEVIIATIDYYREHQLDYVGAGVGSGFPRGMDTEVFSFVLLTEAWQNATRDYEKEHVTPYFYQTCADKLAIGHYHNTQDHSKYRLTLDEPADYQAIQTVYEKLNQRLDFSYAELIQVLQRHPFIYNINSDVEQKK
jgi:spore coat polysaccharide biosynthesis protein SpsF